MKVETSNFACRLTVRDTKQKIAKMVKRGVVWVTWPIFSELWDSLISMEWLKLESSHFAHGLMVRPTIQKNAKMIKRRYGLGHVTYLTK